MPYASYAVNLMVQYLATGKVGVEEGNLTRAATYCQVSPAALM